MDNNNKVSAKDHENYGTYTLLAVIVPVVGIALGIVYMTKDNKLDRKFGEHLLTMGILFLILWAAGYYIITGINTPAIYTPSY